MAPLARLCGDALVEFISLDGEMNMDYYDFYQSPIGNMLLTANDSGLTGAHFVGEK